MGSRCEKGKWKNPGTFLEHYFLDECHHCCKKGLTSLLVGTSLGVHNTPGECQKPNLYRTPGNGNYLGGRDGEGEAQDTGETRFGLPAVVRIESGFAPVFALLLVVGGWRVWP